MIDLIIKDAEKFHKALGTKNPYDLASYLDIGIREDELGSLKGYILFQSRIAIICINHKISEELKKVVICHEIGHYLYHRDKRVSTFTESSIFLSNCKNEYEANMFAAEFLLDDNDTLEAIKSHGGFFEAAGALMVPPELLDMKLKTLKHKGYSFDYSLDATGDFLK